jgi:phospholipase C
LTERILQLALLLLLVTSLFTSPYSLLAQTNQTPIQHVFIIMQENHSFDNYFGTYPTANGTLVNNITTELQGVDGIPAGLCLPYQASCMAPYYANSSSTVSPNEGQLTYEGDVNNGLMNGFPSHSGPQSMAYFDFHQIAGYWDYAEEYGLADSYFSTYLAPTAPNRLALLAGTSPVTGDYGPPPYIPFNSTILFQLQSAGLSWGYFDFISQSSDSSNVYPLNYLSGMTPQDEARVQNISYLLNDLYSGKILPNVVYVSSLGSHLLDEHPPYNITQGELWVVSIVNAVMESSYWNSSAIFLTWDEGGGYFDNLPPPKGQSQTISGENPLIGYGQRVPLLVISPYAKENYVSLTTLNHLSLLSFIEYNWDLPPLDQAVAQSNNLLDFFDFSSPPRPPVILTSSGPFSYSTYPIPLQIPVSQLNYDRLGSSSSDLLNQSTLVPSFYPAVAAVGVAALIFGVSLYLRRRSLRDAI